MAKYDNMLSVIWLLQSRRRMTAAQIADELELSVRTVYRYIDSLCSSGVPIISDSGHEGGYWLSSGFRGTPLFFEAPEVSAIFHATQFAQQAGYPYNDIIESALKKLKRTLTPDQSDHLRRHVDGFGVVQHLRGGPAQQWLSILEAATADYVTLNILYHKIESDQPEWRKVDPYGVAFASGVWYVAVYCHERRALRDFRVDRIKDILTTSFTFKRPADFSVDDHFSDRHMMEWITSQSLICIRVIGKASAISALSDQWFLRLCLVERSRNEAVFQAPAETLEDVAGYLLPFGDQIQVSEPAELRVKIADVCKAWGKHFEENRDVH